MTLTNIRPDASIDDIYDITPNIPIDYTTSYLSINEQIDDTYYIYITPNIPINIIEYIAPDLSIDDTYYIYITPNIPNIALDIPLNNIY